jgi:reductive dehalogenase
MIYYRENKMLEHHISKCRHIISPVKRFDQKNEMYKRARWDESVKFMGDSLYGVMPVKEKEGYTLLDRAFQNAGWYLEMAYAHGIVIHGTDLFSWKKQPADCMRIPKGLKYTVSDPLDMTRKIKGVAKWLGADLVGVCELDSRWVYSHYYHLATGDHGPLEIPEGCRFAISIAVEEEYYSIKTSPVEIGSGGTGLGYSHMAFVAGSLAHFIRDLGYTALASGNDTALSIPIAIDAGLGELGRNGLLITKKYGPRIRLCKVITDLPLVPDRPVEFGVSDFCRVCKKCAVKCPGQAIPYGDRTSEALNISNNAGVLKWPVDAEKCFGFWSKTTSCTNCMRVCSFNKPEGWLHDKVRSFIKHTPWMNKVFVGLDSMLGYDRQLSATEFWEKIAADAADERYD